MNVNAAVSKRPKKNILKGKGKKIFKSSEMPAGLIAKMMADKQLKVKDGDNTVAYMTYSAKMANVDYTRFDSLVTEVIADTTMPTYCTLIK